MQELQANTIATIMIGPFVDKGDGVTPEEGITLSAADSAEVMKHDGTTFVDIAGAGGNQATLTHKEKGMYTLAIPAAVISDEGRLTVFISDESVCLPVWKDFMVLAQAAWISKYTAKDSGYMDIDVKAIGGTATPHTSGKLHVLQGDGNAITAVGPTKTEMDNGHGAIITDTEDLQGNIDTMHDTDLPAVKTVVDNIQTDLGDFSGRTNDKSLLDVLGVPDVAGKDLHTLLVTDRLDNATFGLSAIEGYVDCLPASLGDIVEKNEASVIDNIWDEVLTGAAHNDATSAGRRLRTAGHDEIIMRENTCQAGEDSTHVKLDSGASGSNGYYDHSWIYLTEGTGAGQVRLIDSYVGNTFVAEVHPAWLVNPDGTTTFFIMGRGEVFVHDIEAEGLAAIQAELEEDGASILNTLQDRLTATRAGYLDELDFGLTEAIAALQSDLDNPSQYKADLSTLETRLSATRAGYLDNLSAGAAALEATLTTMKQVTAGGFDRDTDSLQAIRDRGDSDWITGGAGAAPTAAQVADAVWDELVVEHTIEGSAGEALVNATEITLEED